MESVDCVFSITQNPWFARTNGAGLRYDLIAEADRFSSQKTLA
jgi:hypothetical protein